MRLEGSDPERAIMRRREYHNKVVRADQSNLAEADHRILLVSASKARLHLFQIHLIR